MPTSGRPLVDALPTTATEPQCIRQQRVTNGHFALRVEMSALGQKRTYAAQQALRHVRFTPESGHSVVSSSAKDRIGPLNRAVSSKQESGIVFLVRASRRAPISSVVFVRFPEAMSASRMHDVP